ncbi:MAG: GntR family transcriptional regulator [Desulfobacterales bacterium]
MSFTLSGNLAEQIAEYLQDRIIRLEIKPGERIREASVADELGVSRSPVREAFRILEKNRVIEIAPRRGATVTKMTPEFIEDLFDVLFELLGYTGRKCAENGTDAELAKIDEAARRSWSCSENLDLYGYYQAVLDFAMACLDAAQNKLLEQIITELMPSVRRILYIYFAMMGNNLMKDAETVITGNRYVQARNGEMAEKTVRDYMVNLKSHIMTTPSPV